MIIGLGTELTLCGEGGGEMESWRWGGPETTVVKGVVLEHYS